MLDAEETWSQDRLDAESELTEVLRATQAPDAPQPAEVEELIDRLRGVGERWADGLAEVGQER